MKTDMKAVDDMANRISIDNASIRTKLTDIENQPDPTIRTQLVMKLRENLALLVADMANELNNIASKLDPKLRHNGIESIVQRPLDTKSKSRSFDDSSDENSDLSESRRKSRRLMRRRKVKKSNLTNKSTDYSSSSDDYYTKNITKIKNEEPLVISQNVDDLMNENASNSANGSIRKENDFLGFDNDDFDIGIKSEVLLNESLLSQQTTNTNQNNMENNVNDVENKDAESDENTELVEFDEKTVTKRANDQTKNGLIESMDVDERNLSSSSNESDNLLNDVDDEEIRK